MLQNQFWNCFKRQFYISFKAPQIRQNALSTHVKCIQITPLLNIKEYVGKKYGHTTRRNKNIEGNVKLLLKKGFLHMAVVILLNMIT